MTVESIPDNLIIPQVACEHLGTHNHTDRMRERVSLQAEGVLS